MGFWGRRGARLCFFLCLLPSGGCLILRGLCCCCCIILRLLSPRRKSSCRKGTRSITEEPVRAPRGEARRRDASHHLLGVFLAQGRLVRDVKDGKGALLAVRKAGRTAGEQLLGTILEDV